MSHLYESEVTEVTEVTEQDFNSQLKDPLIAKRIYSKDRLKQKKWFALKKLGFLSIFIFALTITSLFIYNCNVSTQASAIESKFKIVAVFSKPIPQPEDYHNFADTNTMFGIPNGMNVLSNIPFLIGGLLGIVVMYFDHIAIKLSDDPHSFKKVKFQYAPGKIAYWVLFISMCFVSIGSAYYHWWPSTTTLFWDRLPMTIAFMSIISIVLTEKVNAKVGYILLYPLVAVGVFSVIWWIYTELHPEYIGDLRLYIFVQMAPVLLTPIIVGVYPDQYTHTGYLYITTAIYVAAKISELLDHQIYHWTYQVMSGHTFKHILAAFGPILLAVMIDSRDYLNKKQN